MSDSDDIHDYQSLAAKLATIDRSNAPTPTSPRELKRRIDHIEQQNATIIKSLQQLEDQFDDLKKTHTGQEDVLALKKLLSALKSHIDDKAPKQNLADLQRYVNSLPTMEKILAIGAACIVIFIALISLASHYHII